MSQIYTSLSKEELAEIIKKAVSQEMQKLRPIQEAQSPDLIKMDEVCQMLHISKPTVYKYINEGRIPAKRLGTRLFFSKKEVLEACAKG